MSEKTLLFDVSVAGGKGPRSMEVGTPHNAQGLIEQEVNVPLEDRKLQREGGEAWKVMCVGAGRVVWVVF